LPVKPVAPQMTTSYAREDRDPFELLTAQR
jgi:hypothetical protein